MSRLLVVASFCLYAQVSEACVVRGRAQSIETYVEDSDGRRFTLSAWAPSWRAEIQGEQAHFHVESYLEFDATAPVGSLPIAPVRPGVLLGMLHLRNRHDISFENPVARGARLTVDVALGGGLPIRLRRARIRCSALRLIGSSLQAAYQGGFRGEDLSEAWAGNDEEEEWEAGRADARRLETSRSDLPSWHLADRVFALTLSRSLRSPGRTFEVPGFSTLWEVARRGHYVKVRIWRHVSYVEGWTHEDNLKTPTSGYGRGVVGFRSRRVAVPRAQGRAVVRVGAEVFASKDASAPWAVVRGTEGVIIAVEGEWARIVSVPGIHAHESVMWVRLADVRVDRDASTL